MVRNTPQSVRDLSSSEQVVKYVQEDGAALSPNSKDSLWSNEAINGNLKRSKKLQSVLIRMSRGTGDEQREETRELHVYKNKSRNVELRDGMEESREEDFDQQSFSTTGGLTAGREQEQERAAIRDHFFHSPAHIAPSGAAETSSPKKKKVVTSPSRQQRPLSPRSRTRLSQTQQARRNTDGSLSPSRGRRRRRNNSVSPRRKIKPQPMESFDMDRPGTPKRTGRNSSPPNRLSQSATVNGTARAMAGGKKKALKRTNGLPDEDDGSSDEGVDFINAQYRQRKSYDHSDVAIKTKFAQSPGRKMTAATTTTTATKKAIAMSDTDDDSFGESTLDSSSSDYDSSTTGNFSVDRVRSRQRKMQRANKKKTVSQKGAASKKKRVESSPRDYDEPPFIDLDIASAATDFVSQIMGQMNFPQPFLFPTSPTKEQKQSQNQKQRDAGKEYNLLRPSNEANDMTSSIFGLFSWDDGKKGSAFQDVGHNRESQHSSNINSPKEHRGRMAELLVQVERDNNNGEILDDEWTMENSVVTENSILANVGSPKKDLIDEQKISEVIKKAVKSPYDDSDGSTATVSANQGPVVNLDSEHREHVRQERRQKDEDDGSSLTYSLEDTVSAQGIEVQPKKNTAALSQAKSGNARNNEDKAKEKVNSLVAKFEDDMHCAKTGKKEAMNTLHEEDKSRSQNLAVSLSASADDSLVSEEEEEYNPTPKARPRGGPKDSPLPKVDRIEIARRNTTRGIGRPAISPNHKHELEAKIKESYERRLKQAAGKEGRQSGNALVSGSVRAPTKSVIPPDAPITTKKVAVNYIQALSKQLSAQSEYASGYVEAMAKTNWGIKEALPTTDTAIPKTSKNEMDDLVSKIDVVIQRLIESGKLPDGNVAESGDLQQRNNTAELLKNLAILRARRSGGAVSSQPHQMQQPSTSLSPPKKTKTQMSNNLMKTSRPEPFVDQSNQLNVKISQPVKNESLQKPSSINAPIGLSNLARIRAKRDEAAMRIKIQTQKLAGLQTDDFPASFQASSVPDMQTFASRLPALADDSSQSRSRSRGSPPRPEDGPSIRPLTPNRSSSNRFERQSDVFSHLSSTRDPSIMRSISVDDSAATALLLQTATPSTIKRSKSAPRTSRDSKSFPVTKLGLPVHVTESSEQHPLFRNGNHNQQYRPSLLATPSDMDMQEWESAELNKLPLILNPSRGEGGSRDEFEQQSWYQPRRADVGASGARYGSYQARNMEEDETTYTDENYDEDEDTATDGTDSSDDFDTDSDSDDDTDTQGSESDGERLERIAMMVNELRSRRLAKSARR